jgi:hypothetical protein
MRVELKSDELSEFFKKEAKKNSFQEPLIRSIFLLRKSFMLNNLR